MMIEINILTVLNIARKKEIRKSKGNLFIICVGEADLNKQLHDTTLLGRGEGHAQIFTVLLVHVTQ